MRKAAQIHAIADGNVLDVVGIERLDLRVLGCGQVVDVVALNGLIEKWQADEQDNGQDQRERPETAP